MEQQNSNYDVSQDESGFQNKTSYASMYFTMFNQRSQLHSMGLDAAAVELFYNLLGDFLPLFDDQFKNNCVQITHAFREDKQYTMQQAKMQMYRLHVSEFAALMVRRGVAPKPDTTLQIYCSDTPKDLKEVFGASTNK